MIVDYYNDMVNIYYGEREHPVPDDAKTLGEVKRSSLCGDRLAAFCPSSTEARQESAGTAIEPRLAGEENEVLTKKQGIAPLSGIDLEETIDGMKEDRARLEVPLLSKGDRHAVNKMRERVVRIEVFMASETDQGPEVQYGHQSIKKCKFSQFICQVVR